MQLRHGTNPFAASKPGISLVQVTQAFGKRGSFSEERNEKKRGMFFDTRLSGSSGGGVLLWRVASILIRPPHPPLPLSNHPSLLSFLLLAGLGKIDGDVAGLGHVLAVAHLLMAGCVGGSGEWQEGGREGKGQVKMGRRV